MSVFVKVIQQKLNPPKPTNESFTGKIVLVTGTSSGLGFEAAQKVAALNAATLIVTARNDEKSAAVKKQMEASLAAFHSDDKPGNSSSSTTDIIPMTLDMSSQAGVRSFVAALKTKVSHLDAAILNAGTIQMHFCESPDSWEQTIQVNAISTLLLGTLLLPLLLASPSTSSASASARPHLNFVSSGLQGLITVAQMEPFLSSSSPVHLLSEQASFPAGLLGGQTQYGRSKLILEYGMRRLSALPSIRGADSKPKVIITSCCPGMCQSDLARNLQESFVLRMGTWLTSTLLARTAEQGANIYLTALTQGDDVHGEMWKDDKVSEPGPMLATLEGKEFGEKVWKELKVVLGEAAQEGRDILGT